LVRQPGVSRSVSGVEAIAESTGIPAWLQAIAGTPRSGLCAVMSVEALKKEATNLEDQARKEWVSFLIALRGSRGAAVE